MHAGVTTAEPESDGETLTDAKSATPPATTDANAADTTTNDATPPPPAVTTTTRKDRDGETVYDEKGTSSVLSSGRINWWGRSEDWADKLGFRGPQDVESPGLEWTHIEAVVSGNRLQYFVNGKLVNEGTDSSFTEGKIMIQSEGAEIYFRRIDLEPLK